MNAISDQIEAARHAAAVFEPVENGWLSVRGADRVKFLHNLLTHNIKAVTEGQGQPACLLDRQGKIRFYAVAHVFPDEIVLQLHPQDLERARQELERYHISEQVSLQEAPRCSVVPLIGPAAGNILSALWPLARLPETPWARVPAPAGSPAAQIVRWDALGLPGCQLWAAPGREREIGEALVNAGAREAGREAFEALRIEAGLPWPRAEIDESVIVNELEGIDLVSYTKGCFIGQEIAARIKWRAHPPRLLRGFLLEAAAPVPRGSPVYAGSEPAGVVTSSCVSPTLGKVIGLGFLKHGTAQDGLQVETPSGRSPARAVELPFVKV